MIDVASTVGATLVLLGFFMVTQKHWTPTGLWFNLTNLAASSILMYVAIETDVLGFQILNAFGIILALVNLARIQQHIMQASFNG